MSDGSNVLKPPRPMTEFERRSALANADTEPRRVMSCAVARLIRDEMGFLNASPPLHTMTPRTSLSPNKSAQKRTKYYPILNVEKLFPIKVE